MFISNTLITGLVAALAVSASVIPSDDRAILVHRDQGNREIGLCHKACGQAIGLSHQTQDACTFTPFLTQYQACLDCAGSTGVEIWQQYTYKLSPVGEKCGLSTAPGEDAETPSATAKPESPSHTADSNGFSETASEKSDEASSSDETSKTDGSSPAGTASSEDEDNAARSLSIRGTLSVTSVAVLGAVAWLF